ncbi:MAG: triose-phosphate isomerase [Phycisphaerales bacterium]|nr:MAG: triose-phosphate isomerase [Phycisphaerales bacterium]
MRKPFVAGNWKMNLNLAECRELMAALRKGLPDPLPIDVAVCPPFALLFPIQGEVDGTPIKVGAQNLYPEPKGAFTGEISATQIRDTGATYVIIGHSERRHVIGETGELIGRKIPAALKAGLEVIYCVGEKIEEREAGRTEAVVAEQLNHGLTEDLDWSRLTIAYEPVWAIGTGKTATPEQAQEAHAFIRQELAARYNAEWADRIRIQYGGSVKPDNADALMSCPDVDGALVGGASLKAGDFLGIIQAAIRSAS